MRLIGRLMRLIGRLLRLIEVNEAVILHQKKNILVHLTPAGESPSEQNKVIESYHLLQTTCS